MTKEEQIIREIRLHSPWIFRDVSAINLRITDTRARQTEGRIFSDLVSPERDHPILIFTGPRNVGKTTLAERLIAGLFFKNSVPKERVLYFTCDEHRYPLDQIIETYTSRILGEIVSELKAPTYMFLDEIQYLENWAPIVKKYSDLSRGMLRFIITGSSSSKIIPQANRYLTGRFLLKPIYPIKFSEFLKVKSKNEALAVPVDEISSRFVSSASSLLNDLASLKKFLGEYHAKLAPYTPEIKKWLDDYLVYGGFPRYVFWDKYRVDSYRQLINEVYAKDVGKKSFFDFMTLLSIIAENEVSEKDISLFQEATGFDPKTIIEILDLAHSSFLLEFAIPYSGSEVVKGKKGSRTKKYYLTDRGLRNAIKAHFLEDDLGYLKLDSIEQGKNAEAVVRDILARLLYHMGYTEPPLYYFVGKRRSRGMVGEPREKTYEVDFVFQAGALPVAVDVGYQSTFNPRHLVSLKEFKKKKPQARTIFVTKDTLDLEDGEHIVIPLYLLCLLV